jgi:hypothetical protein
VSSLNPSKDSIIITQLFGLERVFSNVNPPFRPVGWQLSQSSYEKRIVNKNLTRELFQYLSDFARGDSDRWLILPYSDDKRLNPKSFAVFSKKDALFSKHMNASLGALYTNEDFARSLAVGITGDSSQKVVNVSDDTNSQLECVETEIDINNPDFSFQAIFNRERSLGQLLNYLPQMRDSDLSFLGRSGTSFVTRKIGLGFLCKNFSLGKPEQYLLKFRGTREQLATRSNTTKFYSALVEWNDGRRVDKSKAKTSSDLLGHEKLSNSLTSINSNVLKEFSVTKLTKELSGPSGEELVVWKLLDEISTDYFFQRFQGSVLAAIEASARARIR